MYQGSQRGLKVWFRDEIQNALTAVDTANLELMSTIDSPEMEMYRKGYAAAIRALAAAFGLAYAPQTDPIEPRVVEATAWKRLPS